MGSSTGTLYTGITNNLTRRVFEHKNHIVAGFTDRYNIDRLLYFETFHDAASAINREKQIKKWRREKKVKLIDSVNPKWKDLSKGWYD